MSDQPTAVAPKRITLGFVLAWLFGLLFVIAAVGAALELQPIVSAAFCLAAIVALPPVNQSITAMWNITLSGWLRALIILALLVVAGSQMPKSRIGEDTPPASVLEDKSTTAVRTVEAKELLNIEGSGSKSTEKFTTQGDDWQLQYAYDCANFGFAGNFIVSVTSGDGSFNALTPVNSLGKSGSDTMHYHTGGTFYLEINSECRWHVAVYG